MTASSPSLAASSPGGEKRVCGPRVGDGNLGLLPSHPLPPHHSHPEVPETIELEVQTSTASGLLLWQGVVSVDVPPRISGFPAPWWPQEWERGRRRPQLWVAPRNPVLLWQEVGESGRGKDFISLGLQDGHLVFRWVLAPDPSSPFPQPPYPSVASPPVSPMPPRPQQEAAVPSAPAAHHHHRPTPPPVLPPAHTLLGLCDCSYQLGSGEARLVSEDPINDGEWHRVMALR